METRANMVVALGVAAWLLGCASNAATMPVAYFDVPKRGPAVIEPVGKLPHVVNESSGLARSATPGVFWTINDSGDQARIFAIDSKGKLLTSEQGIAIEGARNIDWEDITTDFNGNLLIGDVGNNNNRRKDLMIYQVPEPAQFTSAIMPVAEAWPVHYPEQYEFPPVLNNYDCEALFVASGQVYALTKHRADFLATLYRLDALTEETSNGMQIICRANLRGAVTAAASWNNGERVAVLTYGGVWVFSPPEADGARLFNGDILWLPLRGTGQCEAVAFIDRETLIITNEQRDVYHVPVGSMSPAQLRYPGSLRSATTAQR